MISNYAPIILFVYARLIHTKKTIEALSKNIGAKNSILIIYSDAAKNKDFVKDVENVRKYLKTVSGFKKIVIIEQKQNKGLANSIIAGVSDTMLKYGKAIILEDDLVTSPYFLKYMNDALNKYKNNREVWHINAYIFPLLYKVDKDVFFLPFSMSWGWATWSDRWNEFERDPKGLVEKFTKFMTFRFNLFGATRSWSQVKRNKTKAIRTWAVFWYATIFLNKGLCLYPKKTLVLNIGHDGTGENCKQSKIYGAKIYDYNVVNFDNEIKVNNKALIQTVQFFWKQNFRKLINKIQELV